MILINLHSPTTHYSAVQVSIVSSALELGVDMLSSETLTGAPVNSGSYQLNPCLLSGH